MRNKTKSLAILGAAAAIYMHACKPTDQSRVMETGGTPVDLRVKSTLTARGDLTLEKTGNAANDFNYRIQSVQLEIASAPDGQIPESNLPERTYFKLGASLDDLKFNILMNTAGAGTCYVNSVLLKGTSDPLNCKWDAGVPQPSATPYPWVTPYPSATPYPGTTPNPSATPGSAAEKNRAACNDIEKLHTLGVSPGTVVAYSDACMCGSRRMAYDDITYRDQVDRFRQDCEAAAAQQ